MNFQDRDRPLLLALPRLWCLVCAIVIVLTPFQVPNLPLPVSAGFWLVGGALLYFVAKVRYSAPSDYPQRLEQRYPLPE